MFYAQSTRLLVMKGVGLSVCLSARLSVSVCLSVSLSLCLSVCLSLSLSSCLYVCACLSLSVCLSVSLSLSVSPSLCLSLLPHPRIYSVYGLPDVNITAQQLITCLFSSSSTSPWYIRNGWLGGKHQVTYLLLLLHHDLNLHWQMQCYRLKHF